MKSNSPLPQGQRLHHRLRSSSPADHAKGIEHLDAQAGAVTHPTRTITNSYFGGANRSHGPDTEMGLDLHGSRRTVTESAPAVIAAIAMPLTYSIANGIGLGFITYALIKIFAGRFAEAKPAVVVLAAVFGLKFALIG